MKLSSLAGSMARISGAKKAMAASARAARALAAAGLPPEEWTEEQFRRGLYAPDLPDPDLLIRTSGELRISNFLLFQSAYTELYFSSGLWPDFDEAELRKALQSYAERRRRFGRVDEDPGTAGTD